MFNQLDIKVQRSFLSTDGVPFREADVFSMKTPHLLENFPPYLLGLGNELIGKLLASALDAIVPLVQVTLFWDL
jgi:hypothetical protein